MRKGFIISILTIVMSCSLSSYAQQQIVKQANIVRKTTLTYLLKVPSNYEANKNERFPLLIFLHGSGERGNDINKVKTHGPPSFVDAREDFPFITVSPQCPEGTWWVTEDLQAMLEQLKESLRIDENRIYVTGLSMGGFGTWAWACKYPEQFAAIAPVCGGGDLQFADELKSTPVWAFHGEEDFVVPVKRTIEMVEAVNASGGKARMTIYPGVGHDSWVNAYSNEELYQWLLSNTRKKK